MWSRGGGDLNFLLPVPCIIPGSRSFRGGSHLVPTILCNVAKLFPISPVPATLRISLPALSSPASCRLPAPLFPGFRPPVPPTVEAGTRECRGRKSTGREGLREGWEVGGAWCKPGEIGKHFATLRNISQ